jgi:hypothetical protein
MAEPWTLAEAQEHLAQWLAADSALSTSQSYTVGSRTYTRAEGKHITSQIAFWRSEVTRLQKSRPEGMRVFRITATP